MTPRASPAATAAAAASLLAMTLWVGCTPGECQSDTQSWGSCTQGSMVDSHTWESGPVDSTYLDFHGGRTWLFDPSRWMGTRAPVAFQAFLSLDPQPNSAGGTGFAEPAGNLAEFLPAGSAFQVNVHNDTCAQYYLRVVLTYADVDAGTAAVSHCRGPDAGAPADASRGD